MNAFNQIFEPQNMDLTLEVWFLILFVAGLATYGLRLVMDLPTWLVCGLLVFGGYFGVVVARATDLVPATDYVTAEIVWQCTHATFAGMFATMAVWFLCALVGPMLVPQRKLQRQNEPKAVVGRLD